MALVKCRECGTITSTDAKSCPHCGARKPAKTSGISLGKVILAIFALVVASAFYQGTPKNTLSSQSALNQADSSSPLQNSTADSAIHNQSAELCNSEKKMTAQGVMDNMTALGVAQTRNRVIEYKFYDGYDNMTPSERKGVITAYADADACLSGKPRSIHFYRKGKLVGKADPVEGITAK